MSKPTLPQLRGLVGNPDAYAMQHTDGTWEPVRTPLNDLVLRRHLDHVDTIGTYVNLGDKARTLVFDVDDGDRAAANRLISALVGAGIPRPFIGLEDSGRKGYHVWLVLDRYIPAEQLRRLGRSVLAVAEVECEVFPKQDEARDLGNLIKLPGGIHQVTGRPNDFVGPIGVPRIYPAALWGRTIYPNLPEQFRGRIAGGQATRFPCLQFIQQGQVEGGRNIALFQFCTLMRRAGLEGEALRHATYAVNDGFEPPLDVAEVEGILANSAMSGPICAQLPADRQCGDLCMLERTSGLSTRPGQLRHASEGESVVVTLGSRVGKVVHIQHDDIVDGKVVLSE